MMGGDEVVVHESGPADIWIGSVFFFPLWEDGSWPGFSEFIPDERQASYLLPCHHGTNGAKAHGPILLKRPRNKPRENEDARKAGKIGIDETSC